MSTRVADRNSEIKIPSYFSEIQYSACQSSAIYFHRKTGKMWPLGKNLEKLKKEGMQEKNIYMNSAFTEVLAIVLEDQVILKMH